MLCAQDEMQINRAVRKRGVYQKQWSPSLNKFVNFTILAAAWESLMKFANSFIIVMNYNMGYNFSNWQGDHQTFV